MRLRTEDGHRPSEVGLQERASNREDQSSGTRQGRAPVPGDQAAVWLYQGSFPRASEEHRTTGDAVRPVEPVDGAQTSTDECRRGTPVIWEMVAARLSWRPETLGDLIVLVRFAAFKIGGG